MKINVVGTSGSGKSTFARALAKALDHPYIEMDAIFWGPNWYEPSDEVFFKDLQQALDQENWVLDGNYTRTTAIKWQNVDQVIWIDYSFIRTVYQAVRRAFSRAFTQKELWPGTGNRESFRNLFSRNSMIWWTLKKYRKNRIKYLKIMRSDAYDHIEFIRLKSPEECAVYIRRARNSGSAT